MPARFVADCMLGRLARWLRAFGFDVLYDACADDHQVIARARERNAVVLTRDTRFPKPPDVRVIHIGDDDVERQVEQVAREVPLGLAEGRLLSRCTVCNETLLPATRGDVWDRVPPFIYLTHETYARCPGCGRVYWEGTHVPRMRRRLAEMGKSARADGRQG